MCFKTHWIPLHNINCLHLGTGPLLEINGILYHSRPILLVLLTNNNGGRSVWVKLRFENLIFSMQTKTIASVEYEWLIFVSSVQVQFHFVLKGIEPGAADFCL